VSYPAYGYKVVIRLVLATWLILDPACITVFLPSTQSDWRLIDYYVSCE